MGTEIKTPQASTVLVTGIGGFLAGHVALQLLQKGYRVRGSLRSLSRAEEIRQDLQRGGAPLEGLSFVEAELMQDAGWAQALAGCDYAIHTASPFPPDLPTHEDALIRPAKEGTLRVLRAAQAAGVRRVVLTSSIAATNYGKGTAPYTEEDWTEISNPEVTPYYKSKTIAEQAAWAFARETGLELAVINPGLILGPLLGKRYGTSAGFVRKMLRGELPALPRFGVSVVDVRDVADAHLRAMLAPEAAGERFIAGGRFLWVKELAQILRSRMPERARKIPRCVLPDCLVKFMACFDPSLRLIKAELGKDRSVSSDKARRVLGWTPRPAEEAIAATARSLIERGLLDK